MLEVRNIWKSYENQPLLQGISFNLYAGETICLLGRSGSGKSTLLRIISGLETAEQGQILWDGEDLAGLAVHRRSFGLMFQDYALFPHRSVAENIAFGLQMQHLPDAEIQNRVAEALDQIRMQDFANRRVTELSGGEQQRVALARALAPRPRLLMLDEPLGALDHSLREQLLEELHSILKQSGIPAIYVTHDQEEAFNIADRLILLHDGKIEQQGKPEEVYEHPATPWAARFFGLSNMVAGKVISTDPLVMDTGLGRFQPDCKKSNNLIVGKQGMILLRPSGAVVADRKTEHNCIHGMVEDVTYQGEYYRVSLRCKGDTLLVFHLPQAPLPGHDLTLKLAPQSVDCLENA